ncbi:hypothetical protein NHX12_001777 [Muraenolepis orangiensis]|uniref:Pre-B-cell leukemia transcription factor-interacting protein 1 n=1 Tax=Muraenolepis orangiensis TaxID=630683 RepID=A0A9Q0E135_9TELE|nr:hypothetical protein NHX12_001777 [Muraenolepis orangiensis]
MENVATLRPLTAVTEHPEDSSCDAESQPPEGATPAKTEHSVENQQGSDMTGPCEVQSSAGIDPSPASTPASDPSPALIPSSETPPPPPSLAITTHSLHGSSDAHSQSEGLPEGPVESNPEPDSFSDSYTHISPSSPDGPPVPELLGGPAADPQARAERGPEDGDPEGDAQCILGAFILLGLGTVFISGVFMDLDEDNNYAPTVQGATEQPVQQEWLKPEAPQAVVDEGTEILNTLLKETQKITAKVQKEVESFITFLVVFPLFSYFHTNEASWLPPVTATTTPPAGQERESRPATAGSTEGQAKKPWQGKDVEQSKERKKEKHDMGEKEVKGEIKESRDRVKTERKDEEQKKAKHEQQERSKEVKGWKQKEERSEGKEQGDKEKQEKDHRGDVGEPWKERGDWNEWKGKEERKGRKEEKEWKKGKSDKLDSDRDDGRKGHEKKEKKDGKDKGNRKEWKGKDEERKEWKEEREWKRGKEARKDKKKEEREWKKAKLDKDGEKEWRGQQKEKEEEKKRDGKGKKEHGKWKQEKEEWKKGKDAHKETGREWREKKEWREKGEPQEWKKHSDRRGENDEHRGGEQERKPWKGKHRPEEGGAKREARRTEDGGKDVDWKKDGKRVSRHDEHADHEEKRQEQHGHGRDEPLWRGDGKPAHTHRRPAFGQPDYWPHQRERLRKNALPSRHCDTVEACARAEGTLPVQLSEFEPLLVEYLAKAEEGAGVDDSARDELRGLAAEFFKDGVFVHDQMSFRDYVEDLADILEDMVDTDNRGEEEEEEGDSDLEDEMEMFGKEVMKRFAVERSSEKEERKTGKSKKENERGRG